MRLSLSQQFFDTFLFFFSFHLYKRQWELSHLLARLSLPPFAYHVYAYDLTPSTTTTPTIIGSHLYQRPQVKHETELNAPNDLSSANTNEISDRYKRKIDNVQEVLA